MTRSEEDQLERIRRREEAERVRERELVLSGKLKPDQEYIKNDKFSHLRKQIEEIDNHHRKKSVKEKRKTSTTKVRWQYMIHKLHLRPDLQPEPSKPEPNQDKAETEETVPTQPRVKRDNPVFDAFDNANDVDDLYRIAESLLNSTFGVN